MSIGPAGAPEVPAYLQDSSGLYYRIGGGTPGAPGVTDHGALTGLTDDDHPMYINSAGDAMTGQLGLVAPTVITNAGRWADGVPRFATVAERDAAYLTIGGALAGMRCYVAATHEHLLYNGTGWQWQATDGGTWGSLWFAVTPGNYPAGINAVKFTNSLIAPNSGVTYNPATGAMTFPPGHTYACSLRMCIMNAAAMVGWSFALSNSPSSFSSYGHSISFTSAVLRPAIHEANHYSILLTGTRYVIMDLSTAGTTLVAGSSGLEFYRFA